MDIKVSFGPVLVRQFFNSSHSGFACLGVGCARKLRLVALATGLAVLLLGCATSSTSGEATLEQPVTRVLALSGEPEVVLEEARRWMNDHLVTTQSRIGSGGLAHLEGRGVEPVQLGRGGAERHFRYRLAVELDDEAVILRFFDIEAHHYYVDGRRVEGIDGSGSREREAILSTLDARVVDFQRVVLE